MNDRQKIRFASLLLSTAAIVGASSAVAGTQVLYGKAPAWVEVQTVEAMQQGKGPSDILYDWQYRMENGTVTTYTDYAVRIDNPDALTKRGTLTLTWLPDKGDLLVHRVSIDRGGETIDVLAGGAQFDVIRREQGLEQRLLDGELTATLPVPGLKIGDVLRVSSSTTLHDQALGDEMQVAQYLPRAPWQVGFARAVVSWPDGEEMFWGSELPSKIEPKLIDGYRRIEIELPLAKVPDMPGDAPSRFRRDAVLRVGTWSDWQELSRGLEPHYRKAAELAPGSEVKAEIDAIMRQHKDPLARAAQALQLVQEDVSYLMNGLDGGNYLPQAADQTWSSRYGDCKAKSVLLYAMLREMGIDAQTVLVSTRGGDALPELLPLAANFDHMIVRATIGGVEYWLDGTAAGARLATIAAIPPFFNALPLTAEGSPLVPMTQREQPFANMVLKATADYSAGLDLPALFEIKAELHGAAGTAIRVIADEADPEKLRAVAASMAGSDGLSAISEVEVDYDDQAAVGTMRLKGVAETNFEWTDGRLVAEDAVSEGGNSTFNADRARPEWRNIPVLTPGPFLNRIEQITVLPKANGAFEFEGTPAINGRFANTFVKATSQIVGNRVESTGEIAQLLGEIAPGDIPAAKRDAIRLANTKVRLVAPQDVTWRWEVAPAEMKRRTAPIVAAFTKAIAFAEEDDHSPLEQRAHFYSTIYDWTSALADFDKLAAVKPSIWMHNGRAEALLALGRREEALAAIQASYDLEPENDTAFYLAEQYAYAGRAQEGLDLLATLPIGEDDQISYAATFATVSGLLGDTSAGLDVLAKEVADKPSNASALNSDCWFRGLFNVQLDTALSVCTKAVENSDNQASALDSRAMVHYRLGQHDAALKDLDAALALSPWLANSRFLKGIVELEMGLEQGRQELEAGLRMAPYLADDYARHGIKPKR